MNCAECGHHVNIHAVGVWTEVTCWSIRRTGGGGNRRDLTPTGRYLCPQCGKLRDLAPAQPETLSLFDQEAT